MAVVVTQHKRACGRVFCGWGKWWREINGGCAYAYPPYSWLALRYASAGALRLPTLERFIPLHLW